ncbi:hypothetical protein GCM10009795_027020 [Nocardioides hankookensis]|uniref:Uncharacterized protein n=1 Tax=Nocardioides hankookensis TaxID=443157 RepID=A0ABW1LCM5_9ACTN
MNLNLNVFWMLVVLIIGTPLLCLVFMIGVFGIAVLAGADFDI